MNVVIIMEYLIIAVGLVIIALAIIKATKKDAGWPGYRHLKNCLHRGRNGC